jgi:hypothetical protein
MTKKQRVKIYDRNSCKSSLVGQLVEYIRYKLEFNICKNKNDNLQTNSQH